ncbi:MAG: lycopene cyclase domain-containing protein [Propionicimonas sp.]
MPFEYLLLMAACLLVTLPLEFVLGARVYRRPRRLALAVLPMLVIFYLWDAVAVARGHWDYSPAHTTGWLFPGALPVEEVVFFIVIPLCGLLTFEAVGRMLGADRPQRSFGSGAAGSGTERPLGSGNGATEPGSSRSLRRFGSGATEPSRRAPDA